MVFLFAARLVQRAPNWGMCTLGRPKDSYKLCKQLGQVIKGINFSTVTDILSSDSSLWKWAFGLGSHHPFHNRPSTFQKKGIPPPHPSAPSIPNVTSLLCPDCLWGRMKGVENRRHLPSGLHIPWASWFPTFCFHHDWRKTLSTDRSFRMILDDKFYIAFHIQLKRSSQNWVTFVLQIPSIHNFWTLWISFIRLYRFKN